MAEPWICKYKAGNLADIPQKEKTRIADYVKSYRTQKKKALLLAGPSGIGKTSLVHALAKDLGLELIEINASDQRNRENILSIIGMASRQQSLFSKGKLILVDEVEGLSGTQDRGGIPALVSVIAKSSFPIILTTDSLEDDRISPLKKVSLQIELSEPTHDEVFAILKRICDKEGISYDDFSLRTLARRNGGDIRAAINDLQSLSGGAKIGREQIDLLSDREQAEHIKDALLRIFKPTGHELSLGALDNVDMDLAEAIMWIDENLPKEYRKPNDLCRAYDALSRADVYMGRIRRWQHWRFLVYASALATAGVASAKDERLKEPVDYVRSRRPLSIWMANQRYVKRKAIAEKIAQKTHTSSKRALTDILPYVQFCIRNNDRAMQGYFDFDDEEVEWLRR